MSKPRELILVYNADSGFFNTIKDGIHKILSPNTYQCNLCALTYGTLMIKDEWKIFIENLDIPSKFLHRDEFIELLEDHPHRIENIEYPAIFLRIEENISLLIQINECKTLDDLMVLISNSLQS
jgi:hypothetical protein